MSNWLAGAAEVVITPPIGVAMTGFAGRPSGAVGIHDDLYARALVLEAEGTRAALVTTDLLGLDFSLVQRIRALSEEQVGIPADRLLLNSSHTHSGPASITLRGMGDPDEPYRDVLVRQIAGALRMAADRLTPASLYFGTAPARVGINRRERRANGAMVLGRNPAGLIDPTVYVLRVDREGGSPLALLFSHAAHPVTLGGSNVWITADYPGVAVSVLRQAQKRDGATPLAMFAQGCCGNINCDRVGSDFEQARRLGTLLGAAAAIASEQATPVEGSVVRGIRETLQLPFLPPPSVAQAEAEVEAARARLSQMEAANATAAQLRVQRGMLAWAEDVLKAARDPSLFPGQPFEVQGIRIGNVAFVALPGEVFIEYGLNIQKASPMAHTVVLAYSNGCIGYVPTAAAYPEGGYEVTTAYKYYGTLMIAPESERLILEAAGRVLRALSAD